MQGLTRSDLATDQSVCAVFMEFEHGSAENLRINLISPAGQEITLVGPGVLNASALTPFVVWNITYLPCAVPVSPDGSRADVWNTSQAWPGFSTYNGTYYPNSGCLEDFNMGDANGEWTVTVQNLGGNTGTLSFFGLQFCDGIPTSCNPCEVFAGELMTSNQVFCEGSVAEIALEFRLEPSGIDMNNYLFALTDGLGNLNWVSNVLEVDNFEPGSYTLCGVATTEDIEALQATVTTVDALTTYELNPDNCIDISNCIDLTIVDVFELATNFNEICLGDTVEFDGLQYFEDIDTFIYFGVPDTICRLRTHLVVEVFEISATIDEVTSPLVCGESAFLDGGDSESTFGPITNYDWTTVDGNFLLDIGPTAQVNSGGTYFLEVSDGLCSAADTIEVMSIDTFFTLVDIVPPSCAGDPYILTVRDSIDLVGPMIDVSIVDVDSPVGAMVDIDTDLNVILVSQPGNYIITTGAGNCENTTTIVLESTNIPAIVLDISQSADLDCTGAPVQLIIDTNVANPELTYDGPEAILDNTLDPMVSTPGEYTVTVTDANGCSATTLYDLLTDVVLPTAEDSTITYDCDLTGLDRLISSRYTGTLDSIRWTGPNSFTASDSIAIVTEAGIYNLTVYDANGCSATAEIDLVINDTGLDFTIGDTLLTCLHTSLDICAVTSSEWTASYEWTDGVGALLSSDSCLTLDQPGSYTLSQSETSGCSGETSFLVTDLRNNVNAVLTADAPGLGCGQESLILDVAASDLGTQTRIQWGRDGTFIASQLDQLSWEITEPGLYLISLFDTLSNCSSTDSLRITQDATTLPLSFTIDTGDCGDDKILLTFDEISNYEQLLINDVEVLITQTIEIDLDGGNTIDLYVRDDNGCEADSTLMITDSGGLSFDLGDDIVLAPGEAYQLDPTFMGIPEEWLYDWSPTVDLSCLDCLDPLLSIGPIQGPSSYTLSLTANDLLGCTFTDSVLVTVETDRPDTSATDGFYMPTIFTPNGIDNQELFVGIDVDRFTAVSISVYDRWGNLVVDAAYTAPLEKRILIWDGSLSGNPVEIGVYTYMATLLHTNGEESLEVGTITLIR